MKLLAQRALRHVGFELIRKGTRFTAYSQMLQALFAAIERPAAVIVGANDGKSGDPFYDVATRYGDRLDVLLIEPQKSLIPALSENFQFCSGSRVYNGAVGPEGKLTLFAVEQRFWSEASKAQEARPKSCRSPSGVTSTSRKHVERWLANFLPSIDPREAIICLEVPSLPLALIIAEAGFGPRIDVLQIDAEGFDDEVIYHSDIPATRPKIIRFEHASLSPSRLDRLSHFLVENGYRLFPENLDTVAVRTSYS